MRCRGLAAPRTPRSSIRGRPSSFRNSPRASIAQTRWWKDLRRGPAGLSRGRRRRPIGAGGLRIWGGRDGEWARRFLNGPGPVGTGARGLGNGLSALLTKPKDAPDKPVRGPGGPHGCRGGANLCGVGPGGCPGGSTACSGRSTGRFGGPNPDPGGPNGFPVKPNGRSVGLTARGGGPDRAGGGGFSRLRLTLPPATADERCITGLAAASIAGAKDDGTARRHAAPCTPPKRSSHLRLRALPRQPASLTRHETTPAHLFSVHPQLPSDHSPSTIAHCKLSIAH